MQYTDSISFTLSTGGDGTKCLRLLVRHFRPLFKQLPKPSVMEQHPHRHRIVPPRNFICSPVGSGTASFTFLQHFLRHFVVLRMLFEQDGFKRSNSAHSFLRTLFHNIMCTSYSWQQILPRAYNVDNARPDKSVSSPTPAICVSTSNASVSITNNQDWLQFFPSLHTNWLDFRFKIVVKVGHRTVVD